jgi:hypothetical protein
MTMGLFFWILMLFWLVLGCYRGWWAAPAPPGWGLVVPDIVLLLMLLLLGWHAFGPPLRP